MRYSDLTLRQLQDDGRPLELTVTAGPASAKECLITITDQHGYQGAATACATDPAEAVELLKRSLAFHQSIVSINGEQHIPKEFPLQRPVRVEEWSGKDAEEVRIHRIVPEGAITSDYLGTYNLALVSGILCEPGNIRRVKDPCYYAEGEHRGAHWTGAKRVTMQILPVMTLQQLETMHPQQRSRESPNEMETLQETVTTAHPDTPEPQDGRIHQFGRTGNFSDTYYHTGAPVILGPEAIPVTVEIEPGTIELNGLLQADDDDCMAQQSSLIDAIYKSDSRHVPVTETGRDGQLHIKRLSLRTEGGFAETQVPWIQQCGNITMTYGIEDSGEDHEVRADHYLSGEWNYEHRALLAMDQPAGTEFMDAAFRGWYNPEEELNVDERDYQAERFKSQMQAVLYALELGREAGYTELLVQHLEAFHPVVPMPEHPVTITVPGRDGNMTVTTIPKPRTTREQSPKTQEEQEL